MNNLLVVREKGKVVLKYIELNRQDMKDLLVLDSWNALHIGGELVEAGLAIIEESRRNFPHGKTYEPKEGNN